MHESSLARAILREVLARADEGGAARVLAVRGWVAESETLSPESLAASFAAMARGKPRLTIRRPASLRFRRGSR